ncbi:MAG: glycosyltransferase [Ignavibacteria bacterium]
MNKDDEKIFISIIVPTFNRSKLLKATIQSIFGQTHQYFELLIVDDGSTDDTKSIIEEINDKRIRYFNVGRTKDIAKVRNFGLKNSNSEYVAFCDDDDLWQHDKLEKQARLLVKYDFICTGAELIDADGAKININKHACSFQHQTFKIYDLLIGNFVITSSVLFKKDKDNYLFHESDSINSAEDYELWLKIAEKNEIMKIDEPLVLFRKHENTSTFDTSTVYIGILNSVIRILSKYKFDSNKKISNYAKYGIYTTRKVLMNTLFANKKLVSFIETLIKTSLALFDFRFLVFYFKVIKKNNN